MSLGDLPLMKAMAAKMNYLDKRQEILAQNIANADTPGYVSKDLTDVDFGSILKKLTGTQRVTMETTNDKHLPNPNVMERPRDHKDRWTYEVAPDKNAVILEEQMVKASKTQMDYNLLTNLMSKQSGMFRTALGRQQ
ncbi:MAG: flagellar basal body rod protein FlgB [Micavibrio sp.]